METTGKKKVLIFEDNRHLRDSLYFLINASSSFYCAEAFPDARQVLHHVAMHKPDVVVMDIEMPGITGIEATRLVKADFPQIRILILTVFEDSEKIFQSLCAGGSGYLLKTATPEQILQALRDLEGGGTPLSPTVAKIMVQFFNANYSAQREDYHLTPKETEVLQCLVDGMSYKMIAGTMKIALETIKTHIKNIYRKLHVSSSPEAVAIAIRQRLV